MLLVKLVLSNQKYKYIFLMTKYLILFFTICDFQIIYYLLRQFVQVIQWFVGD
jgi:hypothetical protein